MNFCPNCGKKLESNETVCSQCGAPVGVSENAEANQQNPVNQPYYSPDPIAKDIENANILGIVSLVFSILGLFVMSTVGFIIGLIGMGKIKKYKSSSVKTLILALLCIIVYDMEHKDECWLVF